MSEFSRLHLYGSAPRTRSFRSTSVLVMLQVVTESMAMSMGSSSIRTFNDLC